MELLFMAIFLQPIFIQIIKRVGIFQQSAYYRIVLQCSYDDGSVCVQVDQM